MKVLVDTNVFLSYLLAPASGRTIARVVTSCFTHDAIDLLIPPEQIEEFADKATTKQYFRHRIPHAVIDHFVTQFQILSLPPLPRDEMATYSRDPKDDYLIAYGIAHEADYLVTGDADLTVLGRVGRLEIVSPARFVGVLRNHNLLA